jgi:hypothetical protein
MTFFNTYKDPLTIADPDHGDEGTPSWEQPDFCALDSDNEFDEIMQLEEVSRAPASANSLYLPEDVQVMPGHSSLSFFFFGQQFVMQSLISLQQAYKQSMFIGI